MQTLHDFITIDNMAYSELSEAKKQKIDLFIQRIKDKGLEEKLLTFVNRKYDVSEQPKDAEYSEIHETNLPKDLSKELDSIWIHLND